MPLLSDLWRKAKRKASDLAGTATDAANTLATGLKQAPANCSATKEALDKAGGDAKVPLKEMLPSKWQVESAARDAAYRVKGLWQGRYRK